MESIPEVMRGKPQLFGTDGVRGIAGRYPLDHRTVRGLGLALAAVLRDHLGSERPQVLLGQDTRESGPWIARALAGGLYKGGAEVAFVGVITTPGLAFLTRHYGFSAGVMVSASHNPFEDNGIKVFSGAGTKMPESVELRIEEALRRSTPREERADEDLLRAEPTLIEPYLNFLALTVPIDHRISRFRLVVDCAHGSASAVAPQLLKQLDIDARILNAEPNGRNINWQSGSLHPENMGAETRTSGADLGVAFDGDADRSIFSSKRGRICDGDHTLFVMAPFLRARKRLRADAVVGTLMTNFGLEVALKAQGIGLRRTPVGDKFVLEEMLRSGINLGGEPSGHVIFSDVSLAGDGIATLLQVLQALSETGESLDELVRDFEPFPQLIVNIRVREKPPLEFVPEIAGALARCREDLGELGRVVIRYSGTEPLARVMVEGEKAHVVEYHASQLAAAIESSLGIRHSGRAPDPKPR
jgi:phosphoglucosamine mutase